MEANVIIRDIIVMAPGIYLGGLSLGLKLGS